MISLSFIEFDRDIEDDGRKLFRHQCLFLEFNDFLTSFSLLILSALAIRFSNRIKFSEQFFCRYLTHTGYSGNVVRKHHPESQDVQSPVQAFEC